MRDKATGSAILALFLLAGCLEEENPGAATVFWSSDGGTIEDPPPPSRRDSGAEDPPDSADSEECIVGDLQDCSDTCEFTDSSSIRSCRADGTWSDWTGEGCTCNACEEGVFEDLTCPEGLVPEVESERYCTEGHWTQWSRGDSCVTPEEVPDDFRVSLFTADPTFSLELYVRHEDESRWTCVTCLCPREEAPPLNTLIGWYIERKLEEGDWIYFGVYYRWAEDQVGVENWEDYQEPTLQTHVQGEPDHEYRRPLHRGEFWEAGVYKEGERGSMGTGRATTNWDEAANSAGPDC